MTTAAAIWCFLALIASLMAGAWAFASDRANKRLRDELDRMDDVNLRLREEIESFKAEKRKWIHDLGCFEDLRLFGMDNLGTYEYMDANPTQRVIAVVARDTCRTLMFYIKEFYYDVNDPEDRDFALREANELIEILKS